MTDPVREYLHDRGCGEHVVKAGLPGLIETWEQIVTSVVQGYLLGLDDYLNDIDVRQLISEAMKLAPASQQQQFVVRLADADTQIKQFLIPSAECLWGEEVAEVEGWSRAKNWWYFLYPKNAGDDLRSELPHS